jgi:hypothetical protein
MRGLGISSECCTGDDTGDWRVCRLRCRCFIKEKERREGVYVTQLMASTRTRKVPFLLQVVTDSDRMIT